MENYEKEWERLNSRCRSRTRDHFENGFNNSETDSIQTSSLQRYTQNDAFQSKAEFNLRRDKKRDMSEENETALTKARVEQANIVVTRPHTGEKKHIPPTSNGSNAKFSRSSKQDSGPEKKYNEKGSNADKKILFRKIP